MFFLKQTHSNDVFLLKNSVSECFQIEGDAIITQEKNVGIGVITADCLPVILYDAPNQAIAVIHAGWKGLSKKIITNTILKMQNAFGTQSSELKAYLGPSAAVCCYEVQKDFLMHFQDTVFQQNIIERRHGKMYFNARLSGIIELLDNHVLQTNIDSSNHVCTICTYGFCSVRKQKEDAGRQPSVVVLGTCT